MSTISAEAVELSFRILEVVLVLRNYTNKEEVIKVAETMNRVAQNNSEYPQVLKDGYAEAINKLKNLSFEEMIEIKNIITD